MVENTQFSRKNPVEIVENLVQTVKKPLKCGVFRSEKNEFSTVSTIGVWKTEAGFFGNMDFFRSLGSRPPVPFFFEKYLLSTVPDFLPNGNRKKDGRAKTWLCRLFVIYEDQRPKALFK